MCPTEYEMPARVASSAGVAPTEVSPMGSYDHNTASSFPVHLATCQFAPAVRS